MNISTESINSLIAQNQFEAAIEQCLKLESERGSSVALSTTLGDLCQQIGHPINAAYSYIKAYQLGYERSSFEKLLLSMRQFSIDIIIQENTVIQSVINILQHEINNKNANANELLGLLLNIINFTRENTIDKNRTWFEVLLIPMLTMLADTKQYHSLIVLETMIYQIMVKQDEHESTFAYMMEKVTPIQNAAGKECAKAQNLQPFNHSPNKRPRIGFFLHSSFVLAHVQVLFSFLRGWSQLGKPDIEPVIYVLSGRRVEEMHVEFSQHGLDIVYLEQHTDTSNIVSNMLYLRQHVKTSNVSVMVWVSVGMLIPFAFGMRIAPKQAWWTMKYHSIELDDIDAYVSGSLRAANPYVKEDWYEGFSSLNRPTANINADEVQQIREQFPEGTLILGTMAREELINREVFLDMVCSILERHENTLFFWTGREKNENITTYFTNRGLSNRHVFIGWVQVDFYAQVFDIYLDCFPYCSGLNLVYTMAAERAVVFNPCGDINYYHIVNALMDKYPDRMSSKDTLFWQEVKSLSQNYLSFASLLIEDPQFRKKSAGFNQRVVENIFYDQGLSAETYIQNFKQIALS